MGKIISAYTLNGKYHFNEETGTSEGHVFVCNDRKVVGYVRDCDGLGKPAIQRIFLGMEISNQRIAYVKGGSSGSYAKPVMSVMDSIVKQNPFVKRYEGFVTNVELAQILEIQLLKFMNQGVADINSLSGLDADFVMDSYFNPEVLRAIVRKGRLEDSTGYLELMLVG